MRVRTDVRDALMALWVGMSLALPSIAAAPMEPAPVTPKVSQPAEARALSRAFADTAKALRPSVVRIDVEQGPLPMQSRPRAHPDLPDFFDRFFGDPELRNQPMRGTGSGVIFDTAGYIVTNRHVVANTRKLTVTLANGKEVTAKVVGKDPRTDVAVLRIENPPGDLVAARLGDSDQAEVGEWVLAVGSPLGMEQTVTAGILSGKGRAGGRIQMSGNRVRRYLQTDAKINPGNSGGPLVNLDGEVIGINTLISAGPGGSYGFAIPINEVRAVATKLIKEGRVAWPYLGVMVGDLDSLEPDKKAELGKNLPARGAFAIDISANSPAEKAGLKAGDVITQLDEQKVETGADVVDYVSARAIGNKVAVHVVREGKPKTLSVTLGELPADEEEQTEANTPQLVERYGLWLQTLTSELAGALGLDPKAKGVVVTDVAPNSPAAKVGLVQGDVIIEIDKKPVSDGAEAARALEVAKAHLVRVKTPLGTRFVTLPK